MEQYGIRLAEVNMSWREFSDLLSCLSSDTALGRIVAIRSEKDSKTIAKFTPAQREIRREWFNQHCKQASEQEYEESMQRLIDMALA